MVMLAIRSGTKEQPKLKKSNKKRTRKAPGKPSKTSGGTKRS